MRTGKSTFIKRFMDVAVLPHMTEEAGKTRAQDELPQSAGGENHHHNGTQIHPSGRRCFEAGRGCVSVKVRLVDCVGFMVDGAAGHMEDGAERLVKTPWYETEIPFTQAAEIGTRKVIADHSTIGIVVTCDGSFGELPRESYLAAEEKTIQELKKLHKPFLVLINSEKALWTGGAARGGEVSGKSTGLRPCPVNCAQLKEDDIRRIMEKVLYEFPVTMVEFYMPKMGGNAAGQPQDESGYDFQNPELMSGIDVIRDVGRASGELQGDYIRRCMVERHRYGGWLRPVVLDMTTGTTMKCSSDLVGEPVSGEYQLMRNFKGNGCDEERVFQSAGCDAGGSDEGLRRGASPAG